MAKKILGFFALLLMCISMNAQPCGIPEPGIWCDPEHPSGMGSPILCELDTLDGYCATMPEQITPEPPGQNNLCGPGQGGTGHNTSWFAFVAGSETIEMNITPSNCTVVGMGLQGIQAGIYEDCTFQNTVVCQPNCVVTTLNLQSSDFVIGQTYFVFIDGCGGSVCDYEIEIVQGAEPFELEDPDDVICNLGEACNPICLGADAIPFFVSEVIGTERYDWTITPPTLDYPDVDGDGLGNIPSEEQTTSLTFNEEGTFLICVGAFHDCDMTDTVCVSVDVVPLENELFDEYFICENEYPDPGPQDEDPNGDGLVGWQGNQFIFPGTFTQMLENQYGCPYEQEITVTSLPVSEREQVDTVYCGSPAEFLGELYFMDQAGENITIDGGAANGCDSLIDLYLTILEASGTLENGPCINGQVVIEFNGFVSPNDDPGTTIEYIWTDQNNNIIEDNDSNNNNVVVDASGTYTLTIVMTKLSVTCTYVIDDIEIDLEDQLPDEPVLTGDPNLNPCETDIVEYSILPDPDPSTAYVWLIPPGATIVSGSGTPNLTIDWTGSAGGQVCVFGTNTCGDGPTTCFDVMITPTPQSMFSVDEIICIDDFATATFTGSAGADATYEWNFGGGMVVNGTMGEGEGPHEITWSDGGEKIITLRVTENGCQSEFFSDTLEVETPIEAPLINCNSSTTGITFTWGDIAGASSYIVTLIDGTAGTYDGNTTYTVTGLMPGDAVTIQVEAVSDGVCPNSFSLETECLAQECDLPDITISQATDSLCVDFGSTIDLDPVFDPVGPAESDGSWSGPGIDPVTGEFDPAAANLGLNTLTFNYSENSCGVNVSTTVFVSGIPTADFSATDTICITDVAQIVYEGSSPDGSFDWNFGGGIEQSGSGAGPYEISFDSPGLKNLTLTVERNNCFSEEFQVPVFVQDTLEDIMINCDEMLDAINFTWNDIAGASEYEVFIDGMSQGFQAGTSFNVAGLSPGDSRSITVVAISDGLCPDKASSLSCQANNCPQTDVSITPGDQSLCLVANAPTVDLDSIISGGFMDGSGIGVWVGPGTDLFNGVFDPAVAGVGVHEIIFSYDENNCASEAMVTITVLPQPTADFNITERICVQDTADISFIGSAGITADFAWTLSGGNISGTNPGPFKVWWNAPGTYDVTLLVTDNTCDSEPVTLQVVVEPELEAPNISCTEQTDMISFSWDPVDCATNYEVLIDQGSGFISQGVQTGTSFDVDGLVPGDLVEIQVIAQSDCECPMSMSSVLCEAKACPPIVLTIDEVQAFCAGDITNAFALNVNIAGSGGTGIGEWSGPGTDVNGNFDPVSAGVGVHTITFDFEEETCQFSESIEIEIYDLPTAILTKTDPTCTGSTDGQITVEASGGDGNYEYFLDGSPMASNIFTDVVSGVHVVRVEDGNNCVFEESIELLVPFNPTMSISAPAQVVFGAGGATASINTDINASSIDSIVWTENGTVICSGANCTDVPIDPQADSEYCATIYYNDLCSISACTDVRVQVVENIYAPNVFSPNRDGSNDFFTIFTSSEEAMIITMNIYDRWGEKVYGLPGGVPIPANQPEMGWNGTFDGERLNPGVYIYFIEVVLSEGEEPFRLKGDVTVLD